METNTPRRISETPKPLQTYYPQNPEETNNFISKAANAFVQHMERLHRKLIILIHLEKKEILVKRGSDASRYTERGRQKIMRMIRQRLRLWRADHGVLLTLTVAEFDANRARYKGMGQLHAWKMINEKGGEFWDELNKWRKRHGKPTVKAYAKSLEEQPGRHYPHLHYYCPGLYFLAPREVISHLWPYGITNVESTFGRSPAEYIIKYLSKVEDTDFMNIMLHAFHLRLYSTSRGLKYGPPVRTNGGWAYQPVHEGTTPREIIEWWIAEDFSIKGQDLTIPRGG